MEIYGTHSEEITSFLKQEGVIFGTSEQYREIITKCCAEVAAAFPELFDELSTLFFYDQDKQQHSDMQQSNAVFWYHTLPESRLILFAIGISSEAAAEGEEFVFLCLLHELAHMNHLIQTGSTDHSLQFHNILDSLICKFNEFTGRSVENDYFGLNEPLQRYDSATQARLSGCTSKQ